MDGAANVYGAANGRSRKRTVSGAANVYGGRGRNPGRCRKRERWAEPPADDGRCAVAANGRCAVAANGRSRKRTVSGAANVYGGRCGKRKEGGVPWRQTDGVPLAQTRTEPQAWTVRQMNGVPLAQACTVPQTWTVGGAANVYGGRSRKRVRWAEPQVDGAANGRWAVPQMDGVRGANVSGCCGSSGNRRPSVYETCTVNWTVSRGSTDSHGRW